MKMIMVIIIVVLMTGICEAGNKDRGYNIYDRQGNYNGRIDNKGQFYDKNDKYDGRVKQTNHLPHLQGD